MTWWQSVILGLLQGLTEFLPVSSSGHLVLAQHILGLQLTPDVTFEVFLHAGTAFSIITVYRSRLWSMITDTIRAFSHQKKAYQTNPNVRIAWQVIFASVPAGLIYAFFDAQLEWTYARPWFACMMLIVTGALLGCTLLVRTQEGELSVLKSVLIGVAQAISLLPGMSRSGATISTGLLAGVRPEVAADFSFIMVLPAIFGATLIKGLALVQSSESIAWIPVLLGTFVAYGTGVFAIYVVLGFVRRGRLHTFALYCVGIGILGLIFV
ncbi:MAG: undecaprenyl-diphosphate phosphatase [Bacteroidetes bacterium]|nr:undecaprenyl-diphosphate phosphatase [Bacteroidota bacterium]MCY4204265.1 undecaprenyl-diphosphate phosphatase [Bacteroidota bacterium]